MPFANLNGFQMHYEIHEEIVPRDTLVIHGNLASNRWFAPAVTAWKLQSVDLSDLNGRLILAEWRGCGKSAAPNSRDELQLANLACDYIELLQHLKIERVNLIGHSTGAAIALLAMSKKPEVFDRAVLLDPVSALGSRFSDTVLDGFVRMSKDRDYCATCLHNTIYNNDSTSPLFEALVEDAFGVAPEVWLGIPYHLETLDIRSEVACVQHPVQILHGEFDQVLPTEGSRQLASLIPNANFFEIKGQGHSTCFENPNLFVRLTNEFLYAK